MIRTRITTCVHGVRTGGDSLDREMGRSVTFCWRCRDARQARVRSSVSALRVLLAVAVAVVLWAVLLWLASPAEAFTGARGVTVANGTVAIACSRERIELRSAEWMAEAQGRTPRGATLRFRNGQLTATCTRAVAAAAKAAECGRLISAVIEGSLRAGRSIDLPPPPGCSCARAAFREPYALASSTTGTVITRGGLTVATCKRRAAPAATRRKRR